MRSTMNPYTAIFLWLGVWNLEAASFWTAMAEQTENAADQFSDAGGAVARCMEGMSAAIH